MTSVDSITIGTETTYNKIFLGIGKYVTPLKKKKKLVGGEDGGKRG
jgi:hypothetical protein